MTEIEKAKSVFMQLDKDERDKVAQFNDLLNKVRQEEHWDRLFWIGIVAGLAISVIPHLDKIMVFVDWLNKKP